MGNLYSKTSKTSKVKKKNGISETDRAVLSLKTQRRKLEDQAKLIEARIEQYRNVAKELLAEKRKDRALLLLKKKKLNEVQLEKLHTWIINVEGMVNNVEMQQQQNKLFAALKEGNEAMKAMQKEFSVDDVQQLMEDTAASKATLDELNAVLSESLSPDQMMEAEEELELLESAVADEQRLELPSVPTTKLVDTTVTESAEPASEENQPAQTESPVAEKRQPLLAE